MACSDLDRSIREVGAPPLDFSGVRCAVVSGPPCRFPESMKILNGKCIIRFGTVSANVECYGQIASICFQHQQPPIDFSRIPGPDPAPEIGEFRNHYELPGFWDPPYPYAVGGELDRQQVVPFVLLPLKLSCWSIPPESPRKSYHIFKKC